MKTTYKISYGHPLGKAGFIVGLLIVVMSIPLFAQEGILSIAGGCVVVTSGILVLLLQNGVILYPEEKRYCYYNTFKNGKQHDLSSYSDVCLLTKRFSQTMNVRASISTKTRLFKYETYLMEKNHIRRIFVGMFDDEDKALERIKEVTRITGAEIKTFNPTTKRKAR